MFVVFDNVSGEPFIVNVKDNGKVIADKAIILCTTEDAVKKVLQKVFGSDDKWNLSRFSILDGRKQPGGVKKALQDLIEFSGVGLFLDENDKVHDEYEVLNELGLL